MRRCCYILFLLVLLSACGDNPEVVALLQQAEGYLPAQADSAEACLNRIPHSEQLSGATGAWYGLLRTATDNRQGKGVNSDSLIRSSYEYYHEASHAGQTSNQELLRRYAQSCYYMGLYYSSCDSTKECEDLLHQAIKGSEKCEDWHTGYLAYTQLSIVTNWSNPQYATLQAKRAFDTYHKINDDVNNEVLILGHIAGCLLSLAEPDSALKYYHYGYELAEKNHLLKSQNSMCMGLANAYCYKGDNERALSYAQRGIKTAEGEVLIPSQLSLAQCYYICDSLDKAKEVLNTISCDSDYTSKYLILRNLSEISIQEKNLDSLSVYVDSAYECLENRFFLAQRVKDEYYQSNLTKELEKEQIQHQAELHRWIWGASTLILLLVASFIIYNVIRHKKRMAIEHQKEVQHQNEIIHQKAHANIILQKLLIEKLDNARQLLSGAKTAQKTQQAWQEVEQLLDSTDNNFVQNLREQHQDFKEEDIQLCMLMRMKTDNATVSNIFNISVYAVKKRKFILKKEGFHVLDPAIHLEDVIERL